MDFYVRGSIAVAIGQLGERTLAPTLVSLLSDKQLNGDVRGRFVNPLQLIINSEEDLQSLLMLLLTSDIADSIYQTLWVLSLRMGVRIISTNTPQGEQYQIVKWSTAP